MHDEAKFLLRDIWLAPDLALLRQEYAADQRTQFLVARWHLLQWRIGVGEPQRTGAAVIRAVRMDFGVDAPVDAVREDVPFDKFAAGRLILGGRGDQLW